MLLFLVALTAPWAASPIAFFPAALHFSDLNGKGEICWGKAGEEAFSLSQNHRIIGWKRPLKIIESNHQPASSPSSLTSPAISESWGKKRHPLPSPAQVHQHDQPHRFSQG